MKKTILIFSLGVFLPALVLGYLALKSAGQQQVLIEDQEARLRQQQADSIASQVSLAVRVEHERFVALVEGMLDRYSPQELSERFSSVLSEEWSRSSLGFSVSASGQLISPSPSTATNRSESTARFLTANTAFIEGEVPAQVYPTPNESLAGVQEELQQRSRKGAYLAKLDDAVLAEAETDAFRGLRQETGNLRAAAAPTEPGSTQGSPSDVDLEAYISDTRRKVVPQRVQVPPKETSVIRSFAVSKKPKTLIKEELELDALASSLNVSRSGRIQNRISI
ncbi:MAG: hypothetical protein AAF558_00940 [Verrucomicrobiota bacterium]